MSFKQEKFSATCKGNFARDTWKIDLSSAGYSIKKQAAISKHFLATIFDARSIRINHSFYFNSLICNNHKSD